MIVDLYRHQAWADAELWRALEAHGAALADAKVHERLHHIHHVQRAFLWAIEDQSVRFQRTKPSDFATAELLKAYAREYHERMLPVVAGLGPDRLQQAVTVPWFKDPPLEITVAEALTQCAMHSHYHRGQNATRLRELGGEPPRTDFIVWLWRGRPEATWP